MVRPETRARPSRILVVKVIASQLRKGNIVDLDGKLYVVLTAESFHPGKGTPTTQIDMRRISDGVKTQMRYKTTDQVERAHVEEVEYSYLYQDGDGFHFMNDRDLRPGPVADRHRRRHGALSSGRHEGQLADPRRQRRSRSKFRRRRRWKSSRPNRP